MSIYATVGTNEPAFFSSNQGWKELSEWAAGLDADMFGDVTHVTEHGFTNDAVTLSQQLESAMVDDPPSDDVRATVDELVDLLVGESGEVIITSGMMQEAAAT
jgi:hypothetical protein